MVGLAKWIKRVGDVPEQPYRSVRTLHDFQALASAELDAGIRRGRIHLPQRPFRPAANPLDWGKN
jgi:hypothetical protein